MNKVYTAPEIEKKVLDYIVKKTKKGPVVEFNPLDLTEEGIADALNLDIEEVKEAIERLSEGSSSGGSQSLKRIESVKPKFDIWLPYTKGGEEIKKYLCESGMAVKGSVNIFYSFIVILVAYIFIFEKPILASFLEINSPIRYFAWGIIITVISVHLGNYFARKWFQLTLLFERVKGYKYYIYTLIGTIILVGISINQGWEKIWLILSVIAALANIGAFIFQLMQNKK